MSQIIDLTRELTDKIAVYPGDESMRLQQTKFIKVDGYNDHRLETGMHVGTHMDGPMHMTDRSVYVSNISLDRLIEKGCLIDAIGLEFIDYKEEYEDKIDEHSIVLVHTGYSQYFGTKRYFEKHPVISQDFVKLLIKKKVKALCLDMPSPDRYPFNIHKMLLENEIVIVENLINLDKLRDCYDFETFIVPLNIRADGSMARVFVRCYYTI